MQLLRITSPLLNNLLATYDTTVIIYSNLCIFSEKIVIKRLLDSRTEYVDIKNTNRVYLKKHPSFKLVTEKNGHIQEHISQHVH